MRIQKEEGKKEKSEGRKKEVKKDKKIKKIWVFERNFENWGGWW
jgi:hypothetical protein